MEHIFEKSLKTKIKLQAIFSYIWKISKGYRFPETKKSTQQDKISSRLIIKYYTT